jgi:hypothetical protein
MSEAEISGNWQKELWRQFTTTCKNTAPSFDRITATPALEPGGRFQAPFLTPIRERVKKSMTFPIIEPT